MGGVDYFTGHGRGGQRRRCGTCNVWRESAGLRRVVVQDAERRGTEPRLSLAGAPTRSGTWTNWDFQSLLLRGSAGCARAPETAERGTLQTRPPCLAATLRRYQCI